MMVAGGAAALAAGGLACRPGDKSKPMTAYFSGLSQALKRARVATPRLIVDRTRMRQNIDRLKGDLPPGLGYRIVAKSLPSFGLLDEVASRSGTDRMMAFNLEFLQILAARDAYYDVLVGKPLPVDAVAAFFGSLRDGANETARDVQWLVDTPARIRQYAELAESQNLDLRLNLEIDVGLHRGGFSNAEGIATAIRLIKDNTRLSFSGFMGYEPHLAVAPKAFGMRERAKQESWKAYRTALSAAQDVLGDEYDADRITRNTAGSPTFHLYQNTEIANEISAGSALVKPSHFDTDMLEQFEPAAFIAAPVIKASDGLAIPHLGFLNSIIESWNPNRRKTFFIYGGHWYAEPVSPEGLTYNDLFGRSSNQEMLNGSSRIDLVPDDYIFFRPQQSEAVFLQFGDIAVYEDGAIVENWPVFPAAP